MLNLMFTLSSSYEVLGNYAVSFYFLGFQTNLDVTQKIKQKSNKEIVILSLRSEQNSPRSNAVCFYFLGLIQKQTKIKQGNRYTMLELHKTHHDQTQFLVIFSDSKHKHNPENKTKI